ncbi:Cullin binding-domain-containing protein [Rhodotorula diobovata]|uniref:Defective in cullin neddylation protein n=1 Tax=Rhodotorula diobovata TaxID=5288 RepID=A0A5C5FL88_9BASI|nr:Cullin binding-domain-containing protein [Rhodotorula diobovata]
MPLLGSTSTPAESAPKGQKKDKKKKPRELPFEEALPAWFAQFADQAEPGKMDGDGIEKLFDDMGLSMDGAYPLILAWKAGAKPGTFGAFYLNDFERAFRQDRIDSSDKLKKFLVQQGKSLLESRAGSKGKTAESIDTDAEEEPDAAFDAANEAFRQFYTFLLPFFRAEGAKTLPADTAKAMWSVVLAPKYELAKGFDQGDQFKAVSTDLWTQLLDFCETVAPDLTGWSEDDAWPSAIDAFVEWKKEKEGAAA